MGVNLCCRSVSVSFEQAKKEEGGSAESASEVPLCDRPAVRNQTRHDGSPDSRDGWAMSQLCRTARNGRVNRACIVVDAPDSERGCCKAVTTLTGHNSNDHLIIFNSNVP